MTDDFAAIAYLEEEIFPWLLAPEVTQAKGEPPGRIRQTHAGGALAAAEGFLRGSLRPGAPGPGRGRAGGEAGDPNPDATARREQFDALHGWAANAGRLIHPRLIAALDRGELRVGGVEHDVFHEVQTGRWIKLTLPGRSGKELQARVELPGVPATLATVDASPGSYLRRLRLANEFLGDDFCLHGLLADPAGPRWVISQRHIQGEHTQPESIARHFTAIGFLPLNAKAFYDPEENLLISDAHGANVLRTAEGLLVPFDVCVQQPVGVLRRAVAPAPSLEFGGHVQTRLNF